MTNKVTGGARGRERGQPRLNTALPVFIQPPVLTSTIAPLASDSQQSPGELGVAALLTHKPVAQQLLTLGLIKSISPSILIQVLSTAIRRVTE